MFSPAASSSTSLGRKVALFALGALIACVGAFAFAASARADAFSTQFDHGQINLGSTVKGEEVLPAPSEITPGSPLPDLWATEPGFHPNQPNLNIDGGLTNGDVTIATYAFQPPIMVVPNPLDQSPVPITLRATDDVTGTYDTGTGELNLSAPLEVRVLVGLNSKGTPTTDAYCSIDLGNMALTSDATTDNEDFVGTAFANGIDGNGALTGSFTVIDDSTPIGEMDNREEPGDVPDMGPPDCTDVNTDSKGIGSLWMSHGIDTPADRPPCPDGTEGVYPDCTPIHTPSADIRRVAIRPVRSVMRAGQRKRLRLAVVNRGDAPAVVTVQIRARRNAQVRVRKQVRLRARPGVTWKPFAIKATRRARGRAVIVAGIAGNIGRAAVRVRPLRHRR